VSVPESEWDQESRDLITALSIWESDLCECGQPRSESMSGLSNFNYHGPGKIRYHAEAKRCNACERLEITKSDYSEDPTPARKFSVEKL